MKTIVTKFPHLKLYLDYIYNAGSNCTPSRFDEDWEPVGERVRTALKDAGLIAEVKGVIVPTFPKL